MDTNSLILKRNTAFYIRRSIGAILLIAMAGVFFFSAYSKLYSENAFDSFQWSFIDLGIGSSLFSGMLARFMIGSEVLLGLMLLAHVFLRKVTYPAIITILSMFIVYLLVLIIKQGNTGNCGCFGDKLAMTPLNAIYKNLGMIAVTLVLMKIYDVKPYPYQFFVALGLGMTSFTLPYILNPIDLGTAPVKYQKPLSLSELYRYDTMPQTDLKTGKHIIAFMSLTCPHCQKAAYLINLIHKEHPDIPFYLVLNGHETQIQHFFEVTHADSIPHLFYKHPKEFADLAGNSIPAIYWVNDTTAEFKSVMTYYQLDPVYLEKWLHGNMKR